MSQRVGLLCCLQLVAAVAFAQPVFQKVFYHGTGSLEATDVILTSDDNVLIAGNYSGGSSVNDCILLKTDKGGNQLWMKSYSFGSSGSFEGVVELDGAYYAGGFMSTGSGSFCMLVKTDTAGNLLWTKRFDYEAYTIFRKMVATPDGSLLLAGMTFDQGADYSFIIKADTAGSVVWQKTILADPSLDFALGDVAVDDDGSIYATGVAENNSVSEAESFVARFDATGTPVWCRRIGSSGEDFSMKRVLPAENGCYVAGYAGDFNFKDALVHVDSTGTLQWAKSYAINNADVDLRSLCYDAAGHIVIGGITSTSGTPADMLVFKTDDAGSLVAANVVNASGNEYAEQTIPFGNDGRLLLVGNARPAIEDALQMTLMSSNLQAPCNNQNPGLFATTATLTSSFLTLTVNNGGNVTDETFTSPAISAGDSVMCGDTTLPIGIHSFEVDGFAVYPNPSSGEFTIQGLKFKAGDVLRIVDVLGKEVHRMPLVQSSPKISMQLEDGIYFVQVQSDDVIVTRKLMIQR